jgi:hypothetical protein
MIALSAPICQSRLGHELGIDPVICTRSKHIIQPACIENQKLEKEMKVSQLIENNSNSAIMLHTLIGFIWAIDEKKSKTTCSAHEKKICKET